MFRMSIKRERLRVFVKDGFEKIEEEMKTKMQIFENMFSMMDERMNGINDKMLSSEE